MDALATRAIAGLAYSLGLQPEPKWLGETVGRGYLGGKIVEQVLYREHPD